MADARYRTPDTGYQETRATSYRTETGNRRPATGDRQPVTGNGKTGNGTPSSHLISAVAWVAGQPPGLDLAQVGDDHLDLLGREHPAETGHIVAALSHLLRQPCIGILDRLRAGPEGGSNIFHPCEIRAVTSAACHVEQVATRETRIRKRGAPQRVGRRILLEGPQVAGDGANLCRRQRASEVESVRHHLGARYPVSDQRRDLGIVGGLEEVAGAQRRGKATGATNPVTGLAAADEDLRPLVGQELLLLNAGLGGTPVRRTGTAGRPVRRGPSG